MLILTKTLVNKDLFVERKKYVLLVFPLQDVFFIGQYYFCVIDSFPFDNHFGNPFNILVCTLDCI